MHLMCPMDILQPSFKLVLGSPALNFVNRVSNFLWFQSSNFDLFVRSEMKSENSKYDEKYFDDKSSNIIPMRQV